MEKILVLGGTFNPIHIGHLSILEEARVKLRISKGIIIPNGNPPHKETINKRHIYNMCVKGIKDNKNIKIDDFELNNNKKSYTIETLKYLKRKYKKEINFVVGEDFFDNLSKWKYIDEVVEECTFIVINRGNDKKIIKTKVKEFKAKYGGKFIILEVGFFNVSSTQIRKRVKNGENIKYLVPEVVEEYIYDQQLYEGNYRNTIEEIKIYLKNNLSPNRYKHTEGVVKLSKELAKRYGIKEEKAELAGFLHDYAKEFSQEKIKEYANHYKIDITKYVNLSTLHGVIGSKIASSKYNILDKDILNAIENHTTGRIHMSILEKIIYVADIGEENRKDEVREIRKYMFDDLDKSLLEGVKYKNKYLVKNKLTIDKKAKKLMDAMLKLER